MGGGEKACSVTAGTVYPSRPVKKVRTGRKRGGASTGERGHCGSGGHDDAAGERKRLRRRGGTHAARAGTGGRERARRGGARGPGERRAGGGTSRGSGGARAAGRGARRRRRRARGGPRGGGNTRAGDRGRGRGGRAGADPGRERARTGQRGPRANHSTRADGEGASPDAAGAKTTPRRKIDARPQIGMSPRAHTASTPRSARKARARLALTHPEPAHGVASATVVSRGASATLRKRTRGQKETHAPRT